MFASLKLYAGLALIAALAAGMLYAHHKGYESGKASNAATIAQLRGADTDNLATISQLQAENAKWSSKYRADLSATKDVADAERQHAQKLEHDAAQAQRKLHELYATNPTAKRWADERVPAAVTDSLRH